MERNSKICVEIEPGILWRRITDTAVFDDIIKELDGDIDVPGWDADLLEMLNASVKDANDMVSSYGVYGDQEVAGMSGRDRVDHADPPPTTATAAPVSTPAAENDTAYQTPPFRHL